MRLKRDAVRAALAHHLGHAVASRLALLDVVEDRDLGAALIAAFAPDLGGDADLSEVIVHDPRGPSVALGVDDIARHPLLQDWVGLTLAEALAAPFVVGAQGHDRYVTYLPEFGPHQLVDDGGGQLGGVVQLTWSADAAEMILATAIYGVVNPQPAFARYTNLSGQALLLAGRMASQVDARAAPIAAGPASPTVRRVVH